MKIYIIKIICAWCKKVMGEKESLFPGDTHGVCSECQAEQDRLLAILNQEDQGIPFDGRAMEPKVITEADEYF